MPNATARLFHRTRRALLTAALLTLAATTAAQAAAPAVLAQLPGDAKLVVVVNNVKDLSAKISNAAIRLNLTVPPDLAGYLTRLIGITKGFDSNNSAAFAIITQGDEKEAEGGPPAMVLLLPTTDPKAMLAGFQPGDPDKAGISEVTLPGDRGEKGYAATVEKWVAIAQDRAVLETYLARKDSLDKKLPAESLKVFENNDLVAWANVPALTKGVDKLLEDKQQDITGMLDLMNLKNEQNPLASALQKAAINEYFLAVKQYLKDAGAAMVTVRLSDAGATLGLVGQFRPDSPIGKFVAAQKPAHPVTLQGLPNGDFLVAGAMAWDSSTISALAGDIVERVMSDEVVSKDPKAENLGKLFQQYADLTKLISGVGLVLIEPPAGDGVKKSFFSGSYIIETSDPEKLKTQQLELLQNPTLKDLMGPDIKQEIKITPDAVTIKDVKLTKVHTTFTARAETAENPLSPVAKQQIQMINKMYGPDGLTMYIAPVGKRLLIILGSDAGIMEASVVAAQTNSDELTKNPAIAASKTEIVPNAVAVSYLSLGRFINLAANIIKPGGQPLNIPGGAPIVMSEGVSDNTLTMELHVPTTTMTTIKDAYAQIVQMMMGAGGGDGMQP